jgi:HEAT repeat protein
LPSGLIGDASARPALLNALKDSEAIVQGRAAEALGAIGDRSDAPAIAAMVKTGIQGGALNAVAADDLAFPLAPPVEAVRLGLYALVRLGSYDAIASCVVNPNGAAVSAWWPIAYALGRAGDARAAPTLTTLLQTPGRFTAAFAARGLGTLKAQNAAPALRDIVDKRQRDPAIVIEAIRALSAMRDLPSTPVFEKIVAETATDSTLRLEAANALAAQHDPESLDFIIDLMSDPAPGIRGAAIRALAAIDSETFLTTLSGLDPDRDWTVRTSLADALAMLPGEQGPGASGLDAAGSRPARDPGSAARTRRRQSPGSRAHPRQSAQGRRLCGAADGCKRSGVIESNGRRVRSGGGVSRNERRQHVCGARRHPERAEYDRSGGGAAAAAGCVAGPGLGRSNQGRDAARRSGGCRYRDGHPACSGPSDGRRHAAVTGGAAVFTARLHSDRSWRH